VEYACIHICTVMAEGFDRYTGTGNDVEHEAGYDAYMTGVIYLAFICFIHEKKGKVIHLRAIPC